MQTINQENLNTEYTNWIKENGVGQDLGGTSFYEHISKKYYLLKFFNKKESLSVINNAEKCYVYLTKILTCPTKHSSLYTSKKTQGQNIN